MDARGRNRKPVPGWHHLKDVDLDARTALCAVCGPVKIARGGNTGAGSPTWKCDVAKKAQANYKKWAKVGGEYIVDARDRLTLEQDGKCAICATAVPQLHVDHCHATGHIRAGLCPTCNTALGLLKDDPAIALAAGTYLESWQLKLSNLLPLKGKATDKKRPAKPPIAPT